MFRTQSQIKFISLGAKKAWEIFMRGKEEKKKRERDAHCILYKHVSLLNIWHAQHARHVMQLQSRARDYAAETEIAKLLTSLTKAFYMQARPGGIKYH